jgi:hypothetical protein
MKGLPQLSTAVLSRISTNRSMRAYLRNCNLTAACVIVGYLIPATRYIGAMLNMVEQQQVLVLFPSNKIGFEVTIEEVDSNYLMFSLLQIALAKEGYMGKLGLPNYEYSKDIDMILSRSFAKDATLPNPLVDTAAFNYYNLHPIVKETRNRYRMDTDYLCVGEEHVDTLGTLDGRHILLADKCTVPRKWANSFVSGMHPNQHPKLTINRVIPKEEYESWIEMIEAIGAYQQDKEEA